MSEDPTQGTEATPKAEYHPPATQADFDNLVESRLNRERAKYQGFEKYKADSEKLQAIEEANKTALEKAEERATKAEAEAKALKDAQQVVAWKQEVSEATGVKASLLHGTTKEEIEQHAKEIQEAYAPPAAPVIGSEGRKPATSGKTAMEAFGEVFDQLG